MPRPEFTYDEQRECWRKNVRCADGTYTTLRAPTRQELRDKIRQFENERDAGVIHNDRKMVADIVDEWRPLAVSELSYQGKLSINNALDAHIIPQIGNILIKDLKPADIDALMLTLSSKSASLQSKVLMVINRVANYAFENGFIVRNPCHAKKAHGKRTAEVEPLTASQQTKLLEATQNTRVYVFVALALFAGLRREEILGLAWTDVHLDGEYAYIEITHAVHFEGQRPIRSDQLKTKAARRKIPIPSELAGILADEMKKSKSILVVPDAKGNVCSRQAVNRLWGLIENRMIKEDAKIDKKHPHCLKTLDFDVNPHKLRHTYITNLCAKSAETGLDIKTIQYLSGHSNPTITLKIYSHVIKERHNDTALKIQKTFAL